MALKKVVEAIFILGLKLTIAVSVIDRDKIICDFVQSSNLGSLRDEYGWDGWTCDGEIATNLCKPNIFWEGIMCQGDNVTELLLGNKGIIGTIPSSLGSLTDLIWVDFTANKLYGTIPSSLGSLTNLLEITYGENSLYGSIPAEIGYLEKIVNLDLSENSLSGTIPVSLSRLSNLMYLSLEQLRLTGHLSSSLGLLTKLETVQLSHNSLSGPIPSSLGNLPSLGSLHLEYNSFTSTLPSSLGRLSRLEVFAIDHNSISGSFPLSFINMTSLKLLRAYANNISNENVDQLCRTMHSIQIIEVVDRVNECKGAKDDTISPPGVPCCAPDSSLFPLIMVVAGILLIIVAFAVDHHIRNTSSFISSAQSDDYRGYLQHSDKEETDPSESDASRASRGGVNDHSLLARSVDGLDVEEGGKEGDEEVIDLQVPSGGRYLKTHPSTSSANPLLAASASGPSTRISNSTGASRSVIDGSGVELGLRMSMDVDLSAFVSKSSKGELSDEDDSDPDVY
jgi:hypothetical protein